MFNRPKVVGLEREFWKYMGHNDARAAYGLIRAYLLIATEERGGIEKNVIEKLDPPVKRILVAVRRSDGKTAVIEIGRNLRGETRVDVKLYKRDEIDFVNARMVGNPLRSMDKHPHITFIVFYHPSTT